MKDDTLLKSNYRSVNVKHDEIVPEASKLGNKSIFIDFDFSLTYYLICHYLKDNKDFFYDNSKYRDIAFLHDYNYVKNESKTYEHKFIKRHNFICEYYSNKKDDSLGILAGYDTVFLSNNFFDNFDFNNDKHLMNLHKFILKLTKYGCKVYYLMNYLIFEPNYALSIKYKSNQICNSTLDYAYINKYKFIDSYLRCLNKVSKLPVYRILIPSYHVMDKNKLFTNVCSNKYVYKISTKKILKENTLYNMRHYNCLADELSEVLYKIHQNPRPDDISIGSNTFLSFKDFESIKHTPVAKNDRNIISFSPDYKINTLDRESFIKVFNKIRNAKRYEKMFDE